MQALKRKTQGGYTLPELVIYIAVLVVVVGLVVVGLVQFRNIRAEVSEEKIVGTAALQGFDRLMYEIRSASQVDVANSTLGVANSRLVLVTDVGGSNETREFYRENGRIEYMRNGVVEGFITDEEVVVSDFYAYLIPTTEGEAVTVRMVMRSITSSSTPVTFYNTAVLRSAYE